MSTISKLEISTALLLCATLYKTEQLDPPCAEHTGSVREFSIEYSTGNDIGQGEWVPVSGSAGKSEFFNGLELTREVTFNAKSARFWRVLIHSTYNGVPALGDVRFYGRETILHCQEREATAPFQCTKAMTVVSMKNNDDEIFEVRLDDEVLAQKLNPSGASTYLQHGGLEFIFPYGEWFHLAVTSVAGSMYMNGVYVSTTYGDGALSLASTNYDAIVLGCSAAAVGTQCRHPFVGRMDDIAWWNTVLDETSVRLSMRPNNGNVELDLFRLSPSSLRRLSFDREAHVLFKKYDGVATAGYSFVDGSKRGWGASSNPVQLRTLDSTAPGAVTSLRVTNELAIGDQLTVSWNPPRDNGGVDSATITYELWRSDAGGTDSDILVYSGYDRTSPAIGLLEKERYAFRVNARNVLGPGDKSLSVSLDSPTATPPGPPQNLHIFQLDSCDNSGIGLPSCLPSAGRLSVQWDPPARDGGAPVTMYTIKLLLQATGVEVKEWTRESQARSVVTDLDVQLEPASVYTWSITATTTDKDGTSIVTTNPATWESMTTAKSKPGPPTSVALNQAQTTMGSASIFWAAPLNRGGEATISGYNIYRTLSSAADGDTNLMSSNCHVDGTNNCIDDTVYLHTEAAPDTACTVFDPSTCLYGKVGNMYHDSDYEYRIAGKDK